MPRNIGTWFHASPGDDPDAAYDDRDSYGADADERLGWDDADW